MQREYERYGFFRVVHSDSKTRELQSLKHGESRINTLCRVLEVSKKEIKTKEGKKKVCLSGVIADYTAKFPFVSWEEQEELVKNSVVRIENAHVRKWKGMPTLYIGKNSNVRVIEIGKDFDFPFPSSSELMKPKKRTIGEILDMEGALDVIVEGDIVSVWMLISEEKNKMGVILDDGTGALFMMLKGRGREMEKSIRFGIPVRARGNVVNSKYGYVLLAEEVKRMGEGFIREEAKIFLCKYA